MSQHAPLARSVGMVVEDENIEGPARAELRYAGVCRLRCRAV